MIILRILRWLYAAFYFLIGLQTTLALLGIIPMPEFDLSPPNAAFQAALGETGFIVPIMALVFMAAGALMLVQRTAPLRIVLLAPFVVVIFFTHLLLDGSAIWGTTHLGLLALFTWQFRSSYRPLWSHSDTRQPDK